MGKSIRSKIKRKWRSKKRNEINKPMEQEAQRQTTWRLQQQLKKKLEVEEGAAGTTLAALGSMLSGKAPTAPTATTEKVSEPAYVSKPETEKLWGLSCGAAIGEERPFSFVERTWEVERPPPGYTLDKFSALISKKVRDLKGDDAYPAGATSKTDSAMEEETIEMKRGCGKAASARAAAKKRRRQLSAAPYTKRGNNYGRKGGRSRGKGRKGKGICTR